MITGRDPLSQKALELLKQGVGISTIVSLVGSVDQAKKLSRWNNLIQRLPEHLRAKYMDLGLKGLVLAQMIKDGDMGGISEILESCPTDVKRSDLVKMPVAITEKRAKVEELQRMVNSRLFRIEEQEHQLLDQQAELEDALKKTKEYTATLNHFPEDVRSFFADHLGLFDEKIVLAKRLDYRWQQGLKKKQIVQYDDQNYVWLVLNVEALAGEFQLRKKRGYRVEYDADFVPETWYSIPDDAEYLNENIQSLVPKKLQKLIKEIKNKIEDLNSEKLDLQEKIKQLRKRRPEYFLAAIEVSNQLSERDLKTHGKLQDAALRWLYNRGYATAPEITKGNRRWDVVGFNNDKQIVIIEAKASIEDFRRDKKWQEYIPFCHLFYFIITSQMLRTFDVGKLGDAGLLIMTPDGLVEVHQPAFERSIADDVDSTLFLIASSLARRVIYGI